MTVKKAKMFIQAEIPAELWPALLQHIRDFDTAHPDCHFVMLSESEAEESIADISRRFRAVSPGFRFMQVFERGKNRGRS